MSGRVLLIDDEQSMCKLVHDGLAKRGYEVEWRTSGREGIDLLTDQDFDVVVTDLNLRQMSGLDVCRHVSENRPDVPVIVITAFGNMESAIAAVRAGAYDFINKPIEMDALAHAVGQAVQHRRLQQEVKRLTEEIGGSKTVAGLVGESAAMKRVYDLIHRVGDSDASVLLTGESGTGKELVARALHAEGDRAAKSFVAVNCAAVPANLLESELFGHVKGAFTDAKGARSGLFAEAEGGTILLDEVGEMPLEMQPKLLRVLQERTVRPVGGNTERPIDVRIIASTNRDLETEVEEGRFREDLYYRIAVVPLHVPPLRSRGNDILLLAQHFLERLANRTNKAVKGLLPEVAKALLAYDWPGNVRELENFMERAVTLTRFEQITMDDLPEKITTHDTSKFVLADMDSEYMPTLEELTQRYIERVLDAVDGNKTQAARVLGLDRRTLYRKLKRIDQDAD